MATLVTGLAVGCSLRLDVDEPQCRSDDDCSARGFSGAVCQDEACVARPVPPDPVWGCVGQARPEPTAEYDVVLPFIDVLTREPVVGATVTVCSDRDITCAAPQLGPLTTGADGAVRFKLPATFRGYALVKMPTYIDVLVYFSLDQLEANNSLTLIGSDVFDAVAETQGLKREAGLGMVFAASFTCEDKRGVGVKFSSEPPAKTVFYYEGSLPTLATDRTDASGQSGLINLAPGVVNVVSALAEDGRELSRQRVLVRPDTITYLPARP